MPPTDRDIVKSVYPDSYLDLDESIGAYHRWIIYYRPGLPFIAGGGPTPGDAWHNARIHLGPDYNPPRMP